MSDQAQTPTDVIVSPMEHAEDMEAVIVIYRMKVDDEGKGGLGWLSSINSRDSRVGMIREAEFLMFCKTYGVLEGSDG